MSARKGRPARHLAEELSRHVAAGVDRVVPLLQAAAERRRARRAAVAPAASRHPAPPRPSPVRPDEVAHDLNNLLGVIGRSAHLGRARDGSPAADELETIELAARRAVELTQRLTDSHASPGSSAAHAIDVNRVLVALHPVLERVLGNGVRLRLGLQWGAALALIDRGDLERILVNLVTNAREALPRGGWVVITTSTEGTGENATTEITVADTGVGMPREVRARSLDPHFTTKGDRGHGLGLSVVRRIVQATGGTLEISSLPDHGTMVQLRLPRSGQATGSPTAQAVA